MEETPVALIVASAGFLAGLIFGGTANITNFCTMGAISDMVFMGDKRRLRAWFLAIAVGIAGTQMLQFLEVIDLASEDNRAIYLSPTLGWAGAIVGGLLFGFGMTMAGGCGNMTLVRLGGGNLKSVIVFLVMGVFAYMTMRGLIGLARVEFDNATTIDLAAQEIENQGMGTIFGAMLGFDGASGQLAVGAVLVVALLGYCFKDAAFRGSPINIAAGLIIGLLVPVGWWITGALGYDDFDPTSVTSFTFVAPTGDTLQYLMTFTGSSINFGIATVFGVIAGSFVVAMVRRTFAVESFVDANDMLRHLFGAAIMGIGGVMAMGCTIGQGLTGMSTLGLGSLIALISIIGGGVLEMKYLEEGSLGGALKAMVSGE